MPGLMQESEPDPGPPCTRCGLSRRDHGYNQASYGLCGQFETRLVAEEMRRTSHKAPHPKPSPGWWYAQFWGPIEIVAVLEDGTCRRVGEDRVRHSLEFAFFIKVPDVPTLS